jgi:hypothetical protein
MAHHPLSLEETLSQDTDLVLFLTDFTDEKAANVLTAALRSNRNVRRVQIKVAEDIFLPVLWGRVCYTGFLPSLVNILEALKGRESLEDLTFTIIDLAPPEHAAAVRRLLQSTPGLKKLEFYCCHLSLDESMAIAEGLRDSPSSLEILLVIHCLRPSLGQQPSSLEPSCWR